MCRSIHLCVVFLLTLRGFLAQHQTGLANVVPLLRDANNETAAESTGSTQQQQVTASFLSTLLTKNGTQTNQQQTDTANFPANTDTDLGPQAPLLTDISEVLGNTTPQNGQQPGLTSLLTTLLSNNEASLALLQTPEIVANFAELFNYLNTTGNITGVINALSTDPQVSVLSTTLLTVIFESLSLTVFKNNRVSDACQTDLIIFVEELVRGNPWTLRMLDATGKPGSDLSDGLTKFAGSYEECVGIHAVSFTSRDLDDFTGDVKERTSFDGKYCSVTARLPGVPNTYVAYGSGYLQLGLCVPHTCSHTDVEILATIVERALFNNSVPLVPNARCQEGRKDIGTDVILVTGILAIIGCLVVIGTMYDIIGQMTPTVTEKQQNVEINNIPDKADHCDKIVVDKTGRDKSRPQEDSKSTRNEVISKNTSSAEEMKRKRPITKFFLAFSVYTNGKKLLRVDQGGELGAINGIRFLTQAWIILAHTVYYMKRYDANLLPAVVRMIDDIHVTPIVYGEVAVDTFFVLSGVMVTYLTLKQLRKAGGPRNINWFMFYFHRYWRLTPVYMLVIMVGTVILPYTLYGPFWNYDDLLYTKTCRTMWWTNLLYINNFVGVEKKCMEWSWYLSNDMQFYWISPLLLVPFFYQPQLTGSHTSGKKNIKKKSTAKAVNFGAWNVRTLLDRTGNDRPERRTALIATELERYRVDIAALSETRLADEGSLTEQSAGYTFFWIGRSQKERREAGVGFAIKTNLVSKLAAPPKGINDRLMTARIPLPRKKFATLISVYAPTMTNPDEVKEKFYEDLRSTIQTVPKSDKLIVLGDFNARVGTDHKTWNGVLGNQGIGKCNSNGLLLLELCTTFNLLITNTIFRLPNRNKTSWMHPRSKHWHLLDYIIVRQRDRQDVRVTKTMCGAECWTDHRLLISKMKLRISPPRRPQGVKVPKRLNVAKLKCETTKQNMIVALDNNLQTLEQLPNTDVESQWKDLRDDVYTTASDIIGHTTRKHQDWFDDNNQNIQTLLEEKHRLHKALLNDPSSTSKKDAFCSAKKTVQSELRKMQDTWYSQQADNIQAFADRKDMKNFYSSLKTIYGPSSSSSQPLLSANGDNSLITDKKEILERWAQHFDTVLNRPSHINDEAIERLPQVDINDALGNLPTEHEVDKAIKMLSSGKAPGSDSIPAEIYAAGCHTLTEKLTGLFRSIWIEESLPHEMRDASIIHLYKGKGNRNSCDNHRGISLLSIAGKILARVLLNRLKTTLQKNYYLRANVDFVLDEAPWI